MNIHTYYEKYCQTECPYEQTSITGRKQCRHKCFLLDFIDYVEEQEDKKIKELVKRTADKPDLYKVTIDEEGIKMRKEP